jgi:hypothetical protein
VSCRDAGSRKPRIHGKLLACQSSPLWGSSRMWGKWRTCSPQQLPTVRPIEDPCVNRRSWRDRGGSSRAPVARVQRLVGMDFHLDVLDKIASSYRPLSLCVELEGAPDWCATKHELGEVKTPRVWVITPSQRTLRSSQALDLQRFSMGTFGPDIASDSPGPLARPRDACERRAWAPAVRK